MGAGASTGVATGVASYEPTIVANGVETTAYVATVCLAAGCDASARPAALKSTAARMSQTRGGCDHNFECRTKFWSDPPALFRPK